MFLSKIWESRNNLKIVLRLKMNKIKISFSRHYSNRKNTNKNCLKKSIIKLKKNKIVCFLADGVHAGFQANSIMIIFRKCMEWLFKIKYNIKYINIRYKNKSKRYKINSLVKIKKIQIMNIIELKSQFNRK